MIMGVVADDVTGANDIGIMFAKGGCLAHVYFYGGKGDYANRWQGKSRPDVAILDTNSRLDSAKTAYSKVFTATQELHAAGARRFFKKTCSVFRGNIGAEFDAMLDGLAAYGYDPFAVIILGFPKNGRTTVDGIHYVHGLKLEESEFRNDPIHPMTRSNLVEILQSQTPRRVGLIPHEVVSRGSAALKDAIQAVRGNLHYVILDVTKQDDLRTIAEAVQDIPVLCGSSAVAEELPRVWGILPGEDEPLGLPPLNGVGILTVAGSLMPQTAAQISYLQEHGVPDFVLDTSRLFGPTERKMEIDRLARGVTEQLAAGRDVLLRAPNDPQLVRRTQALGEAAGLLPRETARIVSETLADAAAAVMERAEPGARRMIAAGGETSNAVCHKLRVRGMRIWKEIQPGLPSCLSLTEPTVMLVLKSGSFGSPEFLAQAAEHLRSA